MENRLSCPYCGTPVKGTENFCRYCGRLIKTKTPDASLDESGSSVELAIPNDVLEQIEVRVQLDSIESRLISFKDEVSEMDTLLRNADMPIDEYKDRIAKIKDEVKTAKGSKVELEGKKQPFPFEQHKVQLNDLKEKIAKLEKLRSSKQVGDDAYKSLSREYQLKKRELENMIMGDASSIKNWMNLLSVEKNSVKKQLDIMSAKQAVGEVSDKDYTEEKRKLESRFTRAEYGIELLKKYLTQNLKT